MVDAKDIDDLTGIDGDELGTGTPSQEENFQINIWEKLLFKSELRDTNAKRLPMIYCLTLRHTTKRTKKPSMDAIINNCTFRKTLKNLLKLPAESTRQ